MKWFYIISLGVVALLLASPLLLGGRDPDEYADIKANLGRDPVIRFDTYGSGVKSIDPASCGDTTSAGIQGNIYESLYAYHYLIRPPKVVPQLAAALPEISKDGLTYTIKIKPGVKYHRNPCFGLDKAGKPKTRTVRAADFVLAYKRIADHHVQSDLSWTFLSERIVGIDDFRKKTKVYKLGDFSRYDLPVEGLKAIDELTLQIRLTERFPQFLYVLAMHVYAPIPREAMDYWFATEDDGKGGRTPLPPEKPRSTEFRGSEQVVGTGPYILKTFKRRQRIVLVRNMDYREDYYPKIPDMKTLTEQERKSVKADIAAGLYEDAGKRVPFIDVLEQDFVAETYSMWMKFLSKQTDATGIPKAMFHSVITPDKKLADDWAKKGVYLKRYSSPSIYWIIFNMEDPVVGASKSLRQALCLAFDVESYIKVLYNGRGKRAVNVIPSSFKGHVEAGPGPYYRLDREEARKKIVAAKAELARAGKLVNGEIPELKFDLVLQSAADAVTADFIKYQFAKVGVKLKIVANDWPTQQRKVRNKQAQIYTMGWHADYPDAENFFQLYYSPNIAKYTNNANYKSPEFDKLYERIRAMPDTPERTKIYGKMARIISEDCPALLLAEPDSFVLYYEWAKNIKQHPIGYGFKKYTRIDTDLRKKLGGR